MPHQHNKNVAVPNSNSAPDDSEAAARQQQQLYHLARPKMLVHNANLSHNHDLVVHLLPDGDGSNCSRNPPKVHTTTESKGTPPPSPPPPPPVIMNRLSSHDSSSIDSLEEEEDEKKNSSSKSKWLPIVDDDDSPVTVAHHTNYNLVDMAYPSPHRRRCHSSPALAAAAATSCSSHQLQRRTIFGSFWSTTSATGDGDSDSQKSAASMRRSPMSSAAAAARHARSRSLNGDNSSNNSINSNNNSTANILMMFSPPMQRKLVLSNHFGDLQDLPSDMQQCLPPMPAPLSRIYRNGGSLGSEGMYPLTSPTSVLHKTSRYCDTTTTSTATTNNNNPWTYSKQQQQETPPPPPPQRQQQSPMNHQEHCKSSSPTGSSSSSPSSSPRMAMSSMPLSMTDSIHHLNVRRNNNVDNDDGSGNDDEESSSSRHRRRIQFDPRVTITEFDDKMPRQWYTDGDLEKFKYETIMLAQHYLMHHPEVAVEYCTGTVDPTTGTVRKKTVYSLPILNDVSIDNDCCDCGSSPKSTTCLAPPRGGVLSSNDYAELATRHVQKILIVDPNKLILDLFCKSLRQIFPHTELTAVQTGEEALHHVKQAFRAGSSASEPGTLPRAYDIVIIEERLHALPLRGFGHSPHQQQVRTTDAIIPTTTCTNNMHQKSLSLSSPRTLQRTKHNSMTGLADYNNNINDPFLQPKFVSGAEVILKLKQLEDDFCRPDRCILEDAEYEDPAEKQLLYKEENDNDDGADNNCSMPPPPPHHVCWRSLVIGVCIDRKNDTIKLWQGGADLVWGKPPPPMGDNLRNQLVSLLVKKRNRCLT